MFSSLKKMVVILFAIGCLIGLVPQFVQFVFLSSENTVVLSEKEKYGDYGVRISDVTENDLKKIEEYKNIERIFFCERKTLSIDEKTYYMFDGIFDDEKMLGIHILNGEMPQLENEIAVDVNYLLQQGYDMDVVGNEIEIQISENSKKSYIVSGIVEINGAFEESVVTEFYLYHYNEQFDCNTVYGSFYNYKNLESDYKQLENIIEGEVYPNLGMYLELGYDGGINLFEQYDYIYLVIFLFILISLCVVIYNIAKIYIYSLQESICVLKLIGVQKKRLVVAFFSCIIFWVGLGICFGVLLSIGLICAMDYKIYQSISFIMDLFRYYDYSIMIKSIFLCLLVQSIALAPTCWKIMALSPNVAVRNMDTSIKENKKKNIFLKNTKAVCWKIAKHDINNEKVMNGIAMLGIVLGIVMITIGFYYVKINYSIVEGNQNYEYRVQLYEAYSSDEQKHKQLKKNYLENFGSASHLEADPLFEAKKTVKLHKNSLSDKYLGFLSQDASVKRKLELTDEIDIDVVILGYTEQELTKLYEINNIEAEIKKNEAIVFSNVYVSGQGKLFEASLQGGEHIQFEIEQESQNESIEIKQCVSALPIYPENSYYNMIIVVDLDTYVAITNEDIPMYVHIRKKITKDKTLFELKRNYTITYPKQAQEEIDKVNIILNVFVYIIFVLCLLVSGALLLSGYYVKIYTKQNEYALLYTIGIRVRKIKKIVILEILLSFLTGIFCSIIISYIATKEIYLIKNPLYGSYLYAFPYKIVVLAIIIAIVFSYIVLKGILRYLEKYLTVNCLENI